MKNIRTCLLFLAVIFPAAAQVWDNTGNGLLNGKYYFREVTLTQSDAFAAYGTINFSNGTYQTDSSDVVIEAANGEGGNYVVSGTYSIAASGFGFINNTSGSILSSPIYGLVGANGVFVGSSTESGSFDIFIAAPLSQSTQSIGTLNGSYAVSYADPLGSLTGGEPFGGLLQFNSNGGGGISNVSFNAYSTDNQPTSQNISNFNYIFSGGAFKLVFPNSSKNLIQGDEFLYSTPDGSFVFGGSPNAFDMMVGVNTGSSASPFGGFYYTAGFQIDNSQLNSGGSPGFSSFYGAINASNGVILGHERIQDFNTVNGYGYTYADSYDGSSGSFTDPYLSVQFIANNGGTEQIGVGIGPFPGITVAVQAPTFNPTSSVYLSPLGIENSASYAPFTAGISRGEYITLAGTNLGPSTLQLAQTVPFPTTLGNVQVMINGIAAPIYYVSANQLAVLVPNETTQAIAEIQVINNGTPSNLVTEFVNQTTPGIFSQTANGIGYGAIEHADGSLVTPDNPAQIGETVQAFLAGLGDTLPELMDGNPAPTDSFTRTSNAIAADVTGVPATVTFAGLAPGFVGLYQVNVTIPSGISSGDNFLDIAGPDSFNSESLISVGAAAAASPEAHLRPRARAKTRTPGTSLAPRPPHRSPTSTE